MAIRKLIAVGNSFALTIDKRTCRLLELDRGTELEVSIEDGDTLLVRAKRRIDRAGQPSRFTLRRTMRVLIQRYGMTPTEFDQISHDRTSLRTFLLDADVGGRVDLVTVGRLALCVQLRGDAYRRRDNTPWSVTIAEALAQYPDLPAPPPPPELHHEGTLAEAAVIPFLPTGALCEP